jgi:transcriptional regulator with XRE-family HTH domain
MVNNFASEIGEKIRQLRKYTKISQSELAEGICTQAFISQVEKGDVCPSSEMLYRISSRLRVDINYFFDNIYCPRMEYVEEVCNQIREYVLKRDYLNLRTIINFEKRSPLFQSGENKQFLLWHEGICSFYVDKNGEQAIELLDQALSITQLTENVYSEREIEILLSKAIIFSELGENNVSLSTYKKVIKYLEFLPYNPKDIKIPIRIFYNYSKTLTKSGHFIESNKYCDEGISSCKTNSSFYALGELYYQKGLNYYLLNKSEDAIYNFEQSDIIFRFIGNYKFSEYALNRLEKIKKKA